MAFPERIAIATANAGKLREIRRICADWPVVWSTFEDLPGPWPEIDEPHESYLENALAKARSIASALGSAAMADDSGLEVDALGGAPGPRSARYAGEDATDERNRRKLLGALEGVPSSDRTARFRCVAALALPKGRDIWAEGICEGTITTEEHGSGGFGYDPIFLPAGSDLTMAELTPDDKERLSHRGRAFRALGDMLKNG